MLVTASTRTSGPGTVPVTGHHGHKLPKGIYPPGQALILKPSPCLLPFPSCSMFVLSLKRGNPSSPTPHNGTMPLSVPQFPPLSNMGAPHHSDSPLPPCPPNPGKKTKERVLIYGHFCASPRTQRRGKKQQAANSQRGSVSGATKGSGATPPWQSSAGRGVWQ